MKYGELKEREIINVNTGEKLGIFGNCDLDIDISNGQITSLLISENSSFFSFFSKQEEYVVIPWEKIVKIGKDTIMISL
ncbi:YlmC/YmxH family sporulation protein [Alkalibaculum sp. M08DMB]|uniref:YlmC/YmxH family sporulation protein n=1 Tax=Alkalibaculum sporogenes TaxID=2655001 RepID=A0A6A7K8Z1_9FIRM|nr:YlmC/YmxH family sporulation protein [Alkalibaculum sporogenes]MPW25825.1 YlmC/YmxH family sporulation protein [Alkalibaculum sporogenes]